MRPTSEAIIGTMYAKWMQVVARSADPHQPVGKRRSVGESHAAVPAHDRVPLAGRATPRTRPRRKPEDETLKILDLHAEVVRDRSWPCRSSRACKSESEKFAGALRTYSIEALMGDGRALQAGTSHNLGQNFAKAFDITFQARDKSVQHVWGTSWGVTTRLVGAVDHDARRRQRPDRCRRSSRPTRSSSCRSAATTGAKPCCPGRRRFSSELRGGGHSRHARRARRAARLEVRRMGAARRAAAARDRTQGHREVRRC